MECVSVCLTICLGLSMGHCFCPFVISLSVCQFVSVSLIFYSAFLSVCLFLCVCQMCTWQSISVSVSLHSSFCPSAYFCASVILSVWRPSICQCFFFICNFVCLCLFLRARHVLCMTARPSISVSFHFSLCLSVRLFPCVRHFVCLTVRISVSVSFALTFLSVCFCGWLHVCLPPNYKIDLLIDDNHFHSVTFIDFNVSNKLFRIQSVNLSVILGLFSVAFFNLSAWS